MADADKTEAGTGKYEWNSMSAVKRREWIKVLMLESGAATIEAGAEACRCDGTDTLQ